jgi:hypothetical protein
MSLMCLKRSYEKPNSKTLNVISTDAELFNFVTKSNGMQKDIRDRKTHCYHLAKNISSSLLSSIIKMIYKAVILSVVFCGRRLQMKCDGIQ